MGPRISYASEDCPRVLGWSLERYLGESSERFWRGSSREDSEVVVVDELVERDGWDKGGAMRDEKGLVCWLVSRGRSDGCSCEGIVD